MHENEQGRGYDGEFFDDPDAPVDKPDWFRERFSNRHRLSARQKRGLLALAREFERPLGMARDLHPLPGRQVRVGVFADFFQLGLEFFDLFLEVHGTCFAQCPELRYLLF